MSSKITASSWPAVFYERFLLDETNQHKSKVLSRARGPINNRKKLKKKDFHSYD